SIWMPCHRGKHLVRITRINGKLRDLLAIAQAKMRPCLTGVGGLVDAVAHGEIRPVQPLTTSDIDNVRVRRRNSNRTDGPRGLLIKHRLPCLTVVIRLPNPAIAHADVEDVWLARYARHSAG